MLSIQGAKQVLHNLLQCGFHTSIQGETCLCKIDQVTPCARWFRAVVSFCYNFCRRLTFFWTLFVHIKEKIQKFLYNAGKILNIKKIFLSFWSNLFSSCNGQRIFTTVEDRRGSHIPRSTFLPNFSLEFDFLYPLSTDYKHFQERINLAAKMKKSFK